MAWCTQSTGGTGSGLIFALYYFGKLIHYLKRKFQALPPDPLKLVRSLKKKGQVGLRTKIIRIVNAYLIEPAFFTRITLVIVSLWFYRKCIGRRSAKDLSLKW